MTSTTVAENLFLKTMFMRVYSTLLQVDNLISYRRPKPTTAADSPMTARERQRH